MHGTRIDQLTFRGISVNLTRLTPNKKTRDALRDRGFQPLTESRCAACLVRVPEQNKNPPTPRRAREGRLKISTCPLLLTQLRLGDDNLSYRRDMTIPNVRSVCACCRSGRRFRSVSLQTLLTGLGKTPTRQTLEQTPSPCLYRANDREAPDRTPRWARQVSLGGRPHTFLAPQSSMPTYALRATCLHSRSIPETWLLARLLEHLRAS